MSSYVASKNSETKKRKKNGDELNLARSETRNTQRSVIGLSFLNKPTFYDGLKSVLDNQQIATITSLQLNKHPLPKQPVPNLEKTAQLYLKSVQPLLSDAEYKNTEKIVHDFIKEGGIGRELYHKLQERYDKTENWMSDWWVQAAYLGYRHPVIYHSSPGTVGPLQNFTSQEDAHRYAAHVVGAICNYNDMIKSCNIKQEMIKDVPLDMQPYAMILGTHRRPDKGVDKLLHTDNANHIIIIRNNHFFKLTLSNNLSEEQLVATLQDISKRSNEPAIPIGILTGNDRDTWANDYDKLKSNSRIKNYGVTISTKNPRLGRNNQILNDFETALFVLCLDKELPRELFTNKNNESIRAIQSLTGFSSSTNAGNRWHDKIVQYIVSYDGFVGMEYEHSPCEALPISVLQDHIINYVKNKLNGKISIPNNFPKAEHLQFELDKSLEHAVEKAIIAVDKLSQNIEMECFNFNEFGANEIKKNKMSPDSFIQIAMQLTFYKLHQKPPVHYETAALRRFKNARTECIRSTCNESVHFAKLFNSDHAPMNVKKAAMFAAVNAHKKLATEATMAEGVDRLFFGLKMIAKDNNIKLPDFFSDVGYSKSSYWNLTSSQVAYKTASFTCYGPVVPEGYGCCCNPRPNDIFFACSSFGDFPETSSKNFAVVLKQVLPNMRRLAQS